MKKAKIFKNGQSEAVRLPKEFRFEDDEVYIHKVGTAVILLPKDSPWDNLIASLAAFSADFLKEQRQQPEIQKRDAV